MKYLNRIVEGLKDSAALSFKPRLAFQPTVRIQNVDADLNTKEVAEEIFEKNDVFSKNPSIKKTDFLRNFTESNCLCFEKTQDRNYAQLGCRLYLTNQMWQM